MKLYQNPMSPNCRKVEAVLQHLKIEGVERVLVDFRKGEHQSAEFRAINPNAKVPALVDGALKLWESSAIMCHLAERARGSLYPQDPARRSDVLRWLFWCEAHFNGAASTVAFERVVKPMSGGQPDAAVIDNALVDFRRHAAVLNGQLEGRKYVLGEALTLADFALAAALTYAQPSGLPVGEYPELARWNAAMDEIPAWKNTAPKFG